MHLYMFSTGKLTTEPCEAPDPVAGWNRIRAWLAAYRPEGRIEGTLFEQDKAEVTIVGESETFPGQSKAELVFWRPVRFGNIRNAEK